MCWYRLSVSLIYWRSFLALWRYSLFSRHPEPPVGRCRRIFVLFVRVLCLYSGVKWGFSFSITSSCHYFCLLASYVNAPDAGAHFRPLFSHCSFYKNVKDSSTSVGMTLERISYEAYVFDTACLLASFASVLFLLSGVIHFFRVILSRP